MTLVRFYDHFLLGKVVPLVLGIGISQGDYYGISKLGAYYRYIKVL